MTFCFRLRSWPAISPSALVIPPSTLWPVWTPALGVPSQGVQSPPAGRLRSTDASKCLPRGPCSCGSGTNAESEFPKEEKVYFVLFYFLISSSVCVSVSRVGSSISVKDFKSSWRSGEAFLVILCSLRPQLVDLSLVQSRSNQENLEEAFHLAERELHIPRLLEPQGEADQTLQAVFFCFKLTFTQR